MSEYKAVWFIVPSYILDLPNIEFSYLRIFETIFQFWNHQKPCFLSNEELMNRSKIKSKGTIIKAFTYFEAHNILKRVFKNNGKRYLIQPEKRIEIDQDNVDNYEKGVPAGIGGGSCRNTMGVPVGTHNKKKYNTKNLKKERERKLTIKNYSLSDFDKDDFYLGDFIEKSKILKRCARNGIDPSCVLEKFINNLKEKGVKNFSEYELNMWGIREIDYINNRRK
jgi:hypothetical protein